ncbi:hypothetical protein FCV43_19015 [Vibrio genomosp. F6]|uniref:hypothetical protein n=1 Tax=Vibrio TaxID=662 RepID=UPI000C83BDE1|nr:MULTISPECIES: hypothetical protein [Vibrio]PMI27876.1 hypothetical protein BCU48_17790 [Vibrio splendidus]TKF15282.1 hypothetical protein FCV43_19015 [Vibrio genomosp. F6]
MKIVKLIFFSFLILTYMIPLQAKERLSFDEWKENKNLYQTKAVGAWNCEQLSNKQNQLVINLQEKQAVVFFSNKRITYKNEDISHQKGSFSAKKTKVIGFDKVDGKIVKTKMSFDYIDFDYSLHILSYQMLENSSDNKFLNFKCIRR